MTSILERALEHRTALFDSEHQCAIRLFNGFTEGCADLVVDIYGDAAVLHNYSDPPERGELLTETAVLSLQKLLPWLRSAVIKTRAGASDHQRCGVQILGDSLPRRVREHGIWYALDLTAHQGCSLYLDTRNLRKWAKEHEYRLIKELWAFEGNRIAVRFAYEWHNDNGIIRNYSVNFFRRK